MAPLNPTSPEEALGMTTTAQEVVTDQNQPTSGKKKNAVDEKTKKRNEELRQAADICKQYRRKLVQNWTINVDYRRAKPFASQSDGDTGDRYYGSGYVGNVAVPIDWSLTKTKQASLFSQVPQVRVSHPPDSTNAGPWLAAYERKLNDTLVTAGIEATTDECLPDCINAAGVGIAIVSYEAITEDKQVPAIDMATFPPDVAAQILESGLLPDGTKLPMETVPQVIDSRYVIQRVSPSDFLWPINFTGSNFDNAPWLGRSGRITWAEAVQKFKLPEEDRDKILGEDRTVLDSLTHDVERDKATADQRVGFDEIFYREFQYDPEAKSYSHIHHLVFLSGKEEPVIDEPWKGQRVNEQDNTVIGAQKIPIRVLTLTYITDDTIPPSDSAIGRPMTNEINKSRTQMINQRERNIPYRWYDVNRVDPAIQQALMRGTWQHMIPVQGEGSRVIGEVAKASHPQEDFTFDSIAKNDLNEAWTIGPNQLGSGAGVETASEGSEIASNFQTRVGRERAKVAAFVVSIAEVLGGLLCLYEDPATFGEGFDPKFSKSLAFSILADSTVLVDANQRLQRLNQFVNMYAKSGFVALEPVLKEIAILTGLDPNVVIKAPDPAPPVEPNISVRLSGAEDIMNPLILAFLLKSGQAPPPELIEQAKQLIQQAVVPPAPLQQPPAPESGELLPEGAPSPIGGSTPLPEPAPPAIGDSHPELSILPKITKRSDDPSSSGEV